jgi:hypothetical protein
LLLGYGKLGFNMLMLAAKNQEPERQGLIYLCRLRLQLLPAGPLI